ncbi:gustatory receptor 8a [Episyrphus balteatus]|uniref:gustatory receptor 8a n=1 Tax=Episyrphus balteatus TaxID=286459 RepID=UPI002484F2F5|nr:gustatory receptor 8a [Episyrphus balteatus]
MKDKIGSVLLWVIYIFRIFGFCPISIHQNPQKNSLKAKFILLWSFIVLAAYNTLILTVYTNYSIFLYIEERFALFNDTLKVTVTCISFNVSAIQSLTSRMHERNFWKFYIKLRSFRRPLVENMTFWEQLGEHWSFIWKFGGLLVINIVFHVSYALLYTTMPYQLQMFWIMYTPFTIVIGIRNAQYILYMNLIRLEVKSLNKDLDTLVEFTNMHFSYETFPHFEEFVRRRLVEKQRIYQLIFEMNECFQKACNWSMVFHLLRGYTRMLVDGYYCAWSVISTGFLLNYDEDDPLEFVFWLAYSTYTYLLRFKTMQIMFYLDLITVEIKCLDRDLQLLVDYNQFGIDRGAFVKFDEFVRKSLLAKQKVYENIYEMVKCFKNANGASEDVLLVPAILEIPMFLLTAKSCMNAAKYISYRVHNLKHSADNIAASVQIQNFSLQLLHQQIKIDGLGIASMDGYMLTKAVGSITTYMVFFIQFMPKFKSKFD